MCQIWKARSSLRMPQSSPICGSSLLFNGCALARDEHGARRIDIEFSGVIPLADGDAYPAAGINVQERLAHRNIHKRPDVRHGDRLFVDFHDDLVPKVIAELLELLVSNVGDERAVGIIQ